MKGHNYDPAWDYLIARPRKSQRELVGTIVSKIKKDLLPLIKEFDDFTIAFIKDKDRLGQYVTGTHSEPVILMNLKEILQGCDEYEVDYHTGIETTITHELAHAIQDARRLRMMSRDAEKQAEDFANEYYEGLTPTLLKKWKKKSLISNETIPSYEGN